MPSRLSRRLSAHIAYDDDWNEVSPSETAEEQEVAAAVEEKVAASTAVAEKAPVKIEEKAVKTATAPAMAPSTSFLAPIYQAAPTLTMSTSAPVVKPATTPAAATSPPSPALLQTFAPTSPALVQTFEIAPPPLVAPDGMATLKTATSFYMVKTPSFTKLDPIQAPVAEPEPEPPTHLDYDVAVEMVEEEDDDKADAPAPTTALPPGVPRLSSRPSAPVLSTVEDWRFTEGVGDAPTLPDPSLPTAAFHKTGSFCMVRSVSVDRIQFVKPKQTSPPKPKTKGTFSRLFASATSALAPSSAPPPSAAKVAEAAVEEGGLRGWWNKLSIAIGLCAQPPMQSKLYKPEEIGGLA